MTSRSRLILQVYPLTDIKAHFEEFKRYKVKCDILDKDIYNFNETGYLIRMVTGSLIIVPASTIIAYIDDPVNRGLVTSTECISAGGYHIPPMITFKGTYHLWKFFKNDMDGNILFSQSEFGFVNDKLILH